VLCKILTGVKEREDVEPREDAAEVQRKHHIRGGLVVLPLRAPVLPLDHVQRDLRVDPEQELERNGLEDAGQRLDQGPRKAF
jgi:hypothetical protein